MSRSTLIWTIIFIVSGIFLAARFAMVGNGKQYVEAKQEARVQVSVAAGDGDANASPTLKWIDPNSEEAADYDLSDPNLPRHEWTEHTNSSARAFASNEPNVVFSMPRTIGIWIAAFLTLAILSFVYGDNPFYKFGEAVVVGASAAYWMVIAFWTALVPNLMGKLWPSWTRSWAVPGLDEDAPSNYFYYIPLVFCVLLLWRLAPKGGWIARWPLAFFIGATAGFRLIGHMETDFIAQISNTILPLWVTDASGGFVFWPTVGNWVIVIGVISTLVYFFFSIEHTGVVGKVSRLGVWVLMVTFGAGFGYTVMGRIALLAARFQFLVDDWLWLMDPMGKH